MSVMSAITTRVELGLWGLLVFTAHDLDASPLTVVNTNDSGSGSLRQAILDADQAGSTSAVTVGFLIPGSGPYSITLLSTLAPITVPIVIDGTTQPGYAGKPIVELNGASVGANGDGLQLYGGNSTVRGLVINRCKRDGIHIAGPYGTNVIQGNYLGIDLTGTLALSNGMGGVTIYRSAGNLVGGTNASARNVISGGNQHGVYLQDTESIGNRVQGNFIGTDVTGKKDLGNLKNGVYLSCSPLNVIGGTVTGAGNVI